MIQDRLSKSMGGFSIGLGLGELLFPKAACEVLDVPDYPGVVQAFGAADVVVGASLLTARNPQPLLWARVLGDVAALSLLAASFRRPTLHPWRRVAGVAAVLGVAAVDLYAARTAPRRGSGLAPMDTDASAAHESWRGSGLAEDVGAPASGQVESGQEAEERRRRMREAERALGLPQV